MMGDVVNGKLTIGRWGRRLLMGVSVLALGQTALIARAEDGPAAGGPTAQAGAVYVFDIATKPLPRALADFSAVTGLQVLYSGSAAYSHTAPALQGSYGARQALGLLLAGSGLAARFTSPTSITLEAIKDAEDALVVDPIAVEGALLRGGLPGTEGTGSYATGATNTATKLTLSPRETPQSVSIMTRQRMDDQNLNEMADVLDETVGMTFKEGGPIGSDANAVYSRGFEVHNFQVNGVSRSTKYGFGDDLSDMAIYDRVEVVRGATGLMSGVGDPSASVNLVRKRPTDTFQSAAELQAGSWNRYRAEGDVASPLIESGRLRGRLVAAYQQGESYIDRLETSKKVLYGVIEADLTEDTLLTAGVQYQHHRSDHASRAGIPMFYSDGGRTDFSRSTSSAADWAYFDNTQLTTFAALEQRFDNDWTVTLDLEHARRSYDALIGYGIRGTPDRETGAGMGLYAGRWAAKPIQNSVGLTATGPITLFGRQHDLMAGFSTYHASYEDPSYPLWSIPGYDTSIGNYYTWNGAIAEPVLEENGSESFLERQVAGYMATRLRPTDDLSIILGGRLTSWSQETESRYADGSSSYSEQSENGKVTPYAGIVYDLSDIWSVYASYTSIFKPQSLQDADGGYLQPLVGDAYEAGIKAAFYDGRLNASLAVFRINQDNLGVADGAALTPSGGQAYKAAKGTTSQGIELELTGEVLPGWQVGGGYAHASPTDVKGKRLLTDIPRDTVKVFSTYRLPGAFDRLMIGGNLRWQGAIYANNVGPNGERATQKAFSVVDVLASYRLTEAVTATLNVNNIFDEKYYSSIGAIGYYGEPRNAMLSVKASF
ncbi:TonB-dependent siderophore receptor [Rhodospirillum rubrum]|nr:TonB-dependent siderophore receptor [Rhodospirillum rubrum]AEO47957.1 TonB-dependent siderophore receptor [Rhodospirillum rubrum F11]QXG81885.1 TonB-dependent siderophore receptor [Rhodospirillum rubrum]